MTPGLLLRQLAVRVQSLSKVFNNPLLSKWPVTPVIRIFNPRTPMAFAS